jgi:hypothetical protein
MKTKYTKWMISLALLTAFFASRAQADGPNLCAEDVEGSYVGQLSNLTAFRVNLMCLDGQRMVASMADLNPTTFMASLPSVDVDGDQVIASVASLRPEDRKSISSKSLFTYVKIDLTSLRSGNPRGLYYNGNVKALLPFTLHRAQAFPKLTPAGRNFAKNSLQGAFRYAGTTVSDPGVLVADVLFDTPFLSLQFTDGDSHHIIDSAKWDGSGLLSATSPAGDTEADGKKTFYLRGRLLNDTTVEFYLVTPAVGLMGPIRASR